MAKTRSKLVKVLIGIGYAVTFLLLCAALVVGMFLLWAIPAVHQVKAMEKTCVERTRDATEASACMKRWVHRDCVEPWKPDCKGEDD